MMKKCDNCQSRRKRLKGFIGYLDEDSAKAKKGGVRTKYCQKCYDKTEIIWV